MSENSINAIQSYFLNGKKYNSPVEWQDATITAEYINDSSQPNLSIDSLQFVLESRLAILEWIENGGIFEGMPIKLDLTNINNGVVSFDGFVDFVESFIEYPDDGIIETSIRQDEGIDSFFNKIGSVTYGYLESIGVIGDSDYKSIDYTVEKKFNIVEVLITTIMIYLMEKELRESIMRLSKDIATISGIASSSLTGSVGALIFATLSALINVAYSVAMVIAIKNMTTSLIESLVPPKRTHKVLSLKRALEVVCSHFGYSFEGVELFDKVHYLPSNINEDEPNSFGYIKTAKGTQKGIPNTLDLGYNCEEMFDLAKKLIDGRFAIINNKVILKSRSDSFWFRNSSYKLPDILIKNKSYNTESLYSTILISFRTDFNDEYTIENYKGTSYEVKTELLNASNQKNVLLKGLKEVSLGVALGSRKDKLTALENLLKNAAQVVDGLTGVLRGGTNFANKVKSRIGVLKVSSNWNNIPKLIYLNGNKIPNNHREYLSAKSLFENYYGEYSFIANSFKSQKAIYKLENIPFGLEDYKKVTNNPYFIFKGKESKITKFEWIIGSDKANVEFWSRDIYTRNLKETKIETE